MPNNDWHLRMYDGGHLQFRDTRIHDSLSFAHVTDFHLPPHPPDLWPETYRPGISWWDVEMLHPNRQLAHVLDEIQSHGVDFVFFGGDTLDYYHPETANRVRRMCQERDLPVYFQIGNHDWESDHIRYVTHHLDEELRAQNCQRLCEHWDMPGLYYSFDFQGVRFVALDTPYGPLESGGSAGHFDLNQVSWLIEQLKYDGPTIIFHHVPFVCATVEERLRLNWNGWAGKLPCIDENELGSRVKRAIENSTNVLGTFVGHAHLRSEAPLGGTWQFMTDAGYRHQWRYVKITTNDPPKSLRIPGTPVVSANGVSPSPPPPTPGGTS